MPRLCTLIAVLLLCAASAHAVSCGAKTCPNNNLCCDDVIMGPTCYEAGQAKCASTGQPAASGSGTSSRLCGVNDDACNTTCYTPQTYQCCNGRLMQKSQTCSSSPSSSAAPTPTTKATSKTTMRAPTTSAPTTAHHSTAHHTSHRSTSAPTTSKPTTTSATATTSAPTTQPPETTESTEPTTLYTYTMETEDSYEGSGTHNFDCHDPHGNGPVCMFKRLCCGYMKYIPSCMPEDNSMKCCEWKNTSTQCSSDATCGANDQGAICGPPGSIFCSRSNAFCNASTQECGPNPSEPCLPSGAPGGYTPRPTTRPTKGPQPTPCPSTYGSGLYCTANETCCGYGTMSPSCMPDDGTKQCCQWYQSATQCDSDQVCGGNLGYGASSQAMCGPPGSTFCDKGDAENTFCTADAPICCGANGGQAFCCASNCSCPTDDSQTCVC